LGRMRDENLNMKDYEWYVDLRRYGPFPHSGFGLGIERLVKWTLNLDHIRDAIPFPRTIKPCVSLTITHNCSDIMNAKDLYLLSVQDNGITQEAFRTLSAHEQSLLEKKWEQILAFQHTPQLQSSAHRRCI